MLPSRALDRTLYHGKGRSASSMVPISLRQGLNGNEAWICLSAGLTCVAEKCGPVITDVLHDFEHRCPTETIYIHYTLIYRRRENIMARGWMPLSDLGVPQLFQNNSARLFMIRSVPH